MTETMKWLGAAILIGMMTALPATAGALANHPSPYLKLHADDPVDWRAWGPEVLEQARTQDRLILLSIGYFACHWCHVMQRESYKDEAVARFLNAHFIAVKVDRELRPELDRRMIQFVENLNGHAGWPLNVFLTPDGYPMTGFTYLPRDQFLSVLEKLETQWKARRDELSAAARAYFEQTEQVESRSQLMSLPDENFSKLVDSFISQAMLIGDEMQGGFGEVAKFPSYPQIAALLEVIRLRPDTDDDLVRFVRLTLDAMKNGHLMDQVNDGFFRYVTDPDWRTPHFEKMLYDNALLARLYFDAHAQWPDAGYAAIGLRTVRFMLDALSSADGGFYASLSAVDQRDVEGGAYYWNQQQLADVLDAKQFAYLKERSALSAEQAILIPVLDGHEDDASTQAEIRKRLRSADRPRMPLDDKRLASWNALVLDALLMAERHSSETELKQHSDSLYRFLRENFMNNGELSRLAGQGEQAETTLEDHAFVARALQHYANQRDSNEASELALALVERAFDLYYVEGRWRQTATSLIPGDRGEAVIQDGVLPSPLTLLLEAIELMPSANPGLRALGEHLSDRLTRDMIDLPFHYASFILHKYRRLSKASKAE